MNKRVRENTGVNKSSLDMVDLGNNRKVKNIFA